MGKYMGVCIGAVVALLGVLGLIRWWALFIMVIKATVPAMLIFGGVIAVIAGISEIKDELASIKEEKK